MNMNKLNVVEIANSESRNQAGIPRKNRRKAAEEKFDRMWEENPEQFNAERDALERERVKRTVQLIQSYVFGNNHQAVDVGCGSAAISQHFAKTGMPVLAIDIAAKPLQLLQNKNIRGFRTLRDYMPKTTLQDDNYDLVICTELIAFMQPDDYRLFFSELARVVKTTGYVICSTPVDIYSTDSLEQFASLSETEFVVEEWVFSYHVWYLKLHRFFSAPMRYVRAWKDPDYRKSKLEHRHALSRLWFKFNSSYLMGYIWKGVSIIWHPFLKLYEQSHALLIGLEKMCRFFSNQAGISHAIWIGKRRPLIVPTPEDEIPIERKGKKQVWE